MEAAAVASQERKANEDFEAAEKKAAKRCMALPNLQLVDYHQSRRSWFGGTGNKEDASELFKSAGIAYRVAHKCET